MPINNQSSRIASYGALTSQPPMVAGQREPREASCRVRPIAVYSFVPNKPNYTHFGPENRGPAEKQTQSNPIQPAPCTWNRSNRTNPKRETRNSRFPPLPGGWRRTQSRQTNPIFSVSGPKTRVQPKNKANSHRFGSALAVSGQSWPRRCRRCTICHKYCIEVDFNARIERLP